MGRPDWVEVGRVRRPHGVHGEVQVVDESDNPGRFLPGSVVYARRPPRRAGSAIADREERRPLEIESVRGRPGRLIVAFRGIADRDEADLLRGARLEIEAADLPDLEEGEYYPFDLEGMAVRSVAGAELGRVVEVTDSPAHAILTIAGSEGELLVPFTQELVPEVDEEQGVIVVRGDLLSMDEPPE